MNEFVSWCRHLLVSFLFHALTSLHPLHFIEMIFPLVLTTVTVDTAEAMGLGVFINAENIVLGSRATAGSHQYKNNALPKLLSR